MNNNRSNSAHYITNNQQYGQGWLVHNGEMVVDQKNVGVPTYSEVVRNMQDFRKAEKLLKNQLVAQQFGLSDPSLKKEILSEQERQRRKLDTKVPPKPFGMTDQLYKKPPHGINIGSPVYETSNMQYGELKPTNFELIEKYYPRNNQFSYQFTPGMYKFDGLNTSVNFSKTHKALDEY